MKYPRKTPKLNTNNLSLSIRNLNGPERLGTCVRKLSNLRKYRLSSLHYRLGPSHDARHYAARLYQWRIEGVPLESSRPRDVVSARHDINVFYCHSIGTSTYQQFSRGLHVTTGARGHEYKILLSILGSYKHFEHICIPPRKPTSHQPCPSRLTPNHKLSIAASATAACGFRFLSSVLCPLDLTNGPNGL
jgi:hypothetical protein